MQLKHLNTLAQGEDRIARILAISWAPNNSKLAYCTADGVIHLVDESGQKKDKFSTKPADAKFGKKKYSVKGIAFSPDSTKIAVGQTDNVVFVYKIGEEWGEKKTICNKFIQVSSVCCLIWLAEGPIIFGLSDGNVRSALIKSSKSHTVYASNSCVVSLAANHRGTGFLSGHADGSIVRYYVAEDLAMERQGRVCTHAGPPYALAWPAGHVIAAGGGDKRVTVYKDGQVARSFDYRRDKTEKEFTVACCSPSGQAVVVGSFDRLRVYSWSPSRKTWEENSPKEIKNLYSITALAWKRDGSRVACGSLCGSVQIFESVLKRLMWKDKFELTYVGPSQVLVKPQAPGAHGVILKSQFGYEIEDVQIMGKDRYIIARTPETILLGDLQRSLLSEIVWVNSGGHERFYLDNESVCLIFNAGELSLVEYGDNAVLGSVRTEFTNPHQISVRLNERGGGDNKKLAYLLDLKTIAIMDLVYGSTVTQVSHDSKIDWLELNETGRKLLYRDVKMRLTLFDVDKNQKTTLLGYSTFVQWVPGSDVVVAQARTDMCVWYNVDTPDRVTTFSIKGEVVDIVRADGKTEVVVQEGFHQLGYELDEGLVEFGTAMHDQDFSRAVSFLERLGGRPEADGMWASLATAALALNDLAVAERCYAALGQVTKVYHVARTRALARETGGVSSPEVQARMALLNHNPAEAEAIFMQHNQVDQAIAMYQQCHKWDPALALAETKGHSDLVRLREQHMQWLTSTKQEERAAEEKEKEGEWDAALALYLKAGLPTRASRLIQNNPTMLNDQDLVAKVAAALLRMELWEQAGQLYEKVNQTEKAFDCYRRGKAFQRAIELARYVSPAEVVGLEEQWGDHLVASKQADTAINHYIEAGRTVKALDAAISSRQWKKAVQIIQVIDDPSSVTKHYAQLGQHYAAAKEHAVAEQLYVQAGMFTQAIEMYNQAGLWESAHRLARDHLSPEQAQTMHLNQASALEDSGKLREAEKLYVSAGQPDSAISMYKKHRQYDHMMRLVGAHHRELVQTTHLHLAQELETEGNLRQAEHHYLAAGEWKGAVNMYRGADKWEEAYKIAKNNGGEAAKQVAFLWAKSLGGEAAVKLLVRLNLLQPCIDYACEAYLFDFAFDLARVGSPGSESDVHYKYAMALEDEGKFREAEDEFVSAGKPKEAVLMYVHNQDWASATRVAEKHDPEAIGQVLVEHAREVFTQKNFPLFESLLLRAQRTDLILEQYKEAGMWVDALRVCREYLPSRLPSLQEEYELQGKGGQGSRDAAGVMAKARHLAESGQYAQAVEAYLKITPGNTQDRHLVVKAWTEVVELTSKFLEGPQVVETAKYLAPQLIEIQEYTLAARLYCAADMVKEAIDMFIRVEDWAKAKKVATDLEPSYVAYVDDCYKDSLRRTGRADRLIDVDVVGALNLLAERGQWEQCLQAANQQSPQVLHKYVALNATQLIKDGFTLEALDLYTRYGAPALPQNFNIYKHLAMEMFTTGAEAYARWAQLRQMLYSLTEALGTGDSGNNSACHEFSSLLKIAHYYATRLACSESGSLDQLVAKLSISLLRYSDIVPADKAYYQAGIAAKAVGRNSEAFVFLNHFLDICEAMDEGTSQQLDHSDLEETDFPSAIPLPASPSIKQGEVEEVKEWVLAVSMDQQVDQVLPVDDRGLYAGSLGSLEGGPAGEQALPACVITGYPVVKHQLPPVEFDRPGCYANREDWTAVTQAAKVAKNANLQDVVSFIQAWCGQSATTFVYN